MKYMAHVFALSMLCSCYGDMYGINEKQKDLDSIGIMIFGSIVCLCCAALYMFHREARITQLQEANEKLGKAAKARLEKIGEYDDEIKQKMWDYNELYRQCEQKQVAIEQKVSECEKKEEKIKGLLLQLDQERCRFGKLLQENIVQEGTIKRLHCLNCDVYERYLQEKRKIKESYVPLAVTRKLVEKLNIDKNNEINELQRKNSELSQACHNLHTKNNYLETRLEQLDVYYSLSSSSSSSFSSSDEEHGGLFKNDD